MVGRIDFDEDTEDEVVGSVTLEQYMKEHPEYAHVPDEESAAYKATSEAIEAQVRKEHPWSWWYGKLWNLKNKLRRRGG